MSRLRGLRLAAGLTQQELAGRAGVSRQLVGAIESGRHLPRVDAGLALADVLGVAVERLFGSDPMAVDVVSGDVPAEGAVVRVGWVGDRMVSAPARTGRDGWDVADATVEEGRIVRLVDSQPGPVVAGCEPGLETLEHLLRQGGVGALAVATSSAGAREALAKGRAHAGVVHGPGAALSEGPQGMDPARFRLASWRVGLAIPPDIGTSWWQRVVDGELAVIQREAGATVQQAFEEAMTRGVSGPQVGGHLAAAHWGMASGLPAVTIEPAALAVGAAFHPLDRHQAELWIARKWMMDRGVEEVLGIIAGAPFQRRLQAVGGYDLDRAGSRVG